jgi:glycosyltransferase involved in cell wall biosynthesis
MSRAVTGRRYLSPALSTGQHASATPLLSVVVLSYNNHDTVVAAVDSLLDQRQPVEIVVSHSGGGPTPTLLARERPQVRVVASGARRSCSEARNAGIQATRAPYVAFLEADCIAEPGWIAGRLREHRKGAQVVASAITNAFPRSRSAWASHLLRYQQRFPDTPGSQRLMLGLSCHRHTFERFGHFREDLPGGEDSEFTARLRELDIVWAGDVRTAHRNAKDPLELMRDHFRRGVRNTQTQQRLHGQPETISAAREALLNVPRAMLWTRRLERETSDFDLIQSWPLMLPATAAYIAGLAAGRRNGT